MLWKSQLKRLVGSSNIPVLQTLSSACRGVANRWMFTKGVSTLKSATKKKQESLQLLLPCSACLESSNLLNTPVLECQTTVYFVEA